MATVEINFNCMCVFVPDPDADAVHVLMPATGTQQSQSGGGGHCEQHVVRILHRTLEPEGVGMEGWALDLGGGAAGPADLTLVPDETTNDAELVDLSALSNKCAPKRFTADAYDPEVNARVTLRAGKLTKLCAEAAWKFGGQTIWMGYRATWRMENVPEDALTWIDIGAANPAPVGSLSELGEDEEDRVVRFAIYHVPPSALPPKETEGPLDAAQVTAHFRALYRIVEEHDPGPHQLPQRPDDKVGKFHCGLAKATLA